MITEKPYFMQNKKWFYHDYEEFKYKLTDFATDKAIKSYKVFYNILEKDNIDDGEMNA